MSFVRKAYPSDFESVYPLLKDFNAEGMSKQRWKLLFKLYFNGDEEHVGYMLLDKNTVVGFIGCIFSKREINGKQFPFCGLSSWIVKPAYRSESLVLFSEVLALKKHTITSFTSVPEAIKILKKLKFKELDNCFYWIPARINRYLSGVKLRFFADMMHIQQKLDPGNLNIFYDHKNFNAHHLLFESSAGSSCYLIFKKKYIPRKKIYDMRSVYFLNKISKLFNSTSFLDKEVSAARILYISNKSLFYDHLKEVSHFIKINYSLDGLAIDSRFYEKQPGIFAFKSLPRISLYKSPYLTPDEIDLLYSELLVLDY
jgi:hypothetical protein